MAFHDSEDHFASHRKLILVNLSLEALIGQAFAIVIRLYIIKVEVNLKTGHVHAIVCFDFYRVSNLLSQPIHLFNCHTIEARFLPA